MGILDGVLGTVGGVVGGLTGGTGNGGTSAGGSAGGSLDTGGLLAPVTGIIGGGTGGSGGGLLGTGVNTNGLTDGLIDLDLLDANALAAVGILPDQDGNGLVNLSLLDQNGDGMVDIGLLNNGLGLSLLDQDGDGLVSLDLLDRVDLSVDAGLDLSGDLDGNGVPDNSTDASDFDVVLTGTAGADRFLIDSNQTTYVDGLGGVDIASYAASANGFNYALGANGVFMSNGDKVDYLQNVERISFSDGTLLLDTGIGETAGYAYRIYQAAFDRAPDAGGLAFWIDALDDGESMVDVAADFLFSPEFQRTYGQLSDTDFVEELYENILNRAGEAAGVDFWSDQLENGVRSRADVLANFADSAENVALVGSTIDAGIFLSA
jgi:hypothetical protein